METGTVSIGDKIGSGPVASTRKARTHDTTSPDHDVEVSSCESHRKDEVVFAWVFVAQVFVDDLPKARQELTLLSCPLPNSYGC